MGAAHRELFVGQPGCRAVGQVVIQEHHVGISHQIAGLFAIMTSRHQSLSVFTGSNLLDRQRDVAGHRDADGIDAAKQVIEMLRKFLIALLRLVSFLRVQETSGVRAGGFLAAVSAPNAR